MPPTVAAKAAHLVPKPLGALGSAGHLQLVHWAGQGAAEFAADRYPGGVMLLK